MKALYRAAERLMAMDEATWARHANPMSAYTRFTVLPLLILAIWSRVWLGWWALLHKSGFERAAPFPGRTYPTGSVMGMPRAV